MERGRAGRTRQLHLTAARAFRWWRFTDSIAPSALNLPPRRRQVRRDVLVSAHDAIGAMIQISIGRILSLLIAIGYLVCAIIGEHGLTVNVLKCSIVLLFPLALIWFPDQIGEATGYFAGHMMRVDTPTPPILIAIHGLVVPCRLAGSFLFHHMNAPKKRRGVDARWCVMFAFVARRSAAAGFSRYPR